MRVKMKPSLSAGCLDGKGSCWGTKPLDLNHPSVNNVTENQ
jgi:hypothetical protein